ncbi:hypothetical protein ACFLS1_07205 [Verrucomicrobiota bacterium]
MKKKQAAIKMAYDRGLLTSFGQEEEMILAKASVLFRKLSKLWFPQRRRKRDLMTSIYESEGSECLCWCAEENGKRI